MKISFCDVFIKNSDPISAQAGGLFKAELEKRTGSAVAQSGKFCFEFRIENESDAEDFSLRKTDGGFLFCAHRLRGLIYAYSLLLRKAEFADGYISVDGNIAGEYSPEKRIRGHQIGYREIKNTYDMWGEDEFRRYFLDLMMFGMNIYEGIPGGEEEKAGPMTVSGDEMLLRTADICDELDLDVSVWAPTSYSESDEDVKKRIHGTYFKMKKLDVLFIPGSDPGDMAPKDLLARCKMIKSEFKKYGRNISIWVSAQAPHNQPDWGENFLEQLKTAESFIDGVIYGPNHAMSMDALFSAVDGKYPMRFYPDITHSVRCEYPVHYDKNDWHYTFACGMGRESIDPRANEYAELYEKVKKYFCGSVSYSDGIHDDVNKIIFSALDFDSSQSAEEILNDYSRAFFYKTDCKKITDIILSLEKNWEGNPALNNQIESTYLSAASMLKKYPGLKNNFRFIMLLFRAECDLLIKKRFVYESALVKKAEEKIRENDVDSAKRILSQDYDSEYIILREKIDEHAELLYRLIGMQLDSSRFGGAYWERGCTLETIDRPVTDRQFLLRKISEGCSAEKLNKIIERCSVKDGEIYFSFCTDGMGKIDRQTEDFYLEFRGDKPENDGSIPVNLLNGFDHFNFRYTCRLEKRNYLLKVTYKDRSFSDSACLTVKINGTAIYSGFPYGGIKNEQYAKEFLPDGYVFIIYKIPENLIGKAETFIEISEPSRGFLISEFFIVGDEENE